MSKILAVGTGPLLEPGVRILGAHCLRTWSLAESLRAAGHEVRLFTLPIPTDRPELQSRAGIETKKCRGFAHEAFLNNDEAHNLARLGDAAMAFQPDGLLGINSAPGALMAKVDYAAPLWVDLYGWGVAEGQAKSAVYGHNALLGVYWAMEEAALRRADKFSAVSMRQLYALHGELAAVGRLNRHTVSYAFAEVMQASYDPFYADPANRDLGMLRVRGGIVPQEAFIVLWSGGYNAWTRFADLLEALERAMAACPDLHYVSTGGALYGHDELSYSRFVDRVQASPHRDRFHLLGWIDAMELPGLYAHADLGLCVDSFTIESIFGTRTRVLNMMAAGTPVLVTRGTELADTLAADAVVLGCPQDDPGALAESLIEASARRDSLTELGVRGRAYVLERFSAERIAVPLRAWAERPAFAPDNEFKRRSAPHAANPFSIPSNLMEQRWARGERPPSERRAKGSIERSKRAVERLIGEERYAALRFLRQEWLRRHWPRYRQLQRTLRLGAQPPLEDLIVSVAQTFQPVSSGTAGEVQNHRTENLRHDSAEANELTREEWRAVASTLPPVERLTLRGGEALLHPQCKEIAQVLARAARAQTLRIETNGMQPDRFEALCAALLEEGLPGALEAWVRIDGLEAAHNALRQNDRAWVLAQQTLACLLRLRDQNAGRFDFGVLTPIRAENGAELEELNTFLRGRFRCRQRFDLASGAGALAAEEIGRALRRIHRRSGLSDHLDYVALRRALRPRRADVARSDDPAAGRSLAFVFNDGSLSFCLCVQPFANLRDFSMDFTRAWTSPQAEAARRESHAHACADPFCLAKAVAHTFAGLLAMLRELW